MWKVNKNDRNHQIWKQSPLSVNITSPKFVRQKMNYIHNNPVKADLVDSNENYTFSSYKSYFDGRMYFDFLTLW